MIDRTQKVIIIVASLFLLTRCEIEREANKWLAEMPNITSFSSPRVADLNSDGVFDIVFGAGSNEWYPSDSGVIALNGKTGAVLWHVSVKNQIVGSASFIKINKDSVPDVIIGGRTGELYAINGSNGDILWEFYKPKSNMSYRQDSWFNFFNSQIIGDVDRDNTDDILICNGGDPYIQDHITKRPSGKIMIISGRTGKVISSANVPDGKETYFSPVISDMGIDNSDLTIVFGTGGETIGGTLYSCKLQDLLKNNLSNAIALETDSIRGFVAPPILSDVDGDSIYDIIVNGSSGRTFVISGKTNLKLWEFKYTDADVEVYSSPGIGYFWGDDRVPDFFVSYSKGNYPNYYGSVMFLLDGKTGHQVKKYEGAQFTYVSPLTFDVNDDLVDDIVYVSNHESKTSKSAKIFTSLEVFDFKMDTRYNLISPIQGANFAMTPWIGDLDGNNKVDIICSSTLAYSNRYPGISSFGEDLELKVSYKRTELSDKHVRSVFWGSYMGNNYKSIATPKHLKE